MAKITLKGNPINTSGDLPVKGQQAHNFTLVKSDLGTLSLSELKGKKVLLNIFPSLDTSVCATSVRKFNQYAAGLPNVAVLAILPMEGSVQRKAYRILQLCRGFVMLNSAGRTVSTSLMVPWPAFTQEVLW